MRQRWKENAMITVEFIHRSEDREKEALKEGKNQHEIGDTWTVFPRCNVNLSVDTMEKARVRGSNPSRRKGLEHVPRESHLIQGMQGHVEVKHNLRWNPEGLVRHVKECVQFPLSQFFSILAAPYTRGASEIYSDPILRDLNYLTWGRSWSDNSQC